MRRAVLLTLVLLNVGGCAKTTWHRSGSTEQDLASDSEACQRDAGQSGYYGILAGPANMRDFQERCLRARGWTAQTD